MSAEDLFSSSAQAEAEKLGPLSPSFVKSTTEGGLALSPSEGKREERFRNQPLAARMRPRSLDEFVGQSHILAPGQLLRRAIEADRIQSLIFYGPPGTGKTSLAQVIARQTTSKFERLSGVESNVADMRRGPSAAAQPPAHTRPPPHSLLYH